jgi:hypothetical protein
MEGGRRLKDGSDRHRKLFLTLSAMIKTGANFLFWVGLTQLKKRKESG